MDDETAPVTPGSPDATTRDSPAPVPDDGPDDAHVRPAGVDDATVEALGKLSEALEAVEHARGLLYGFHRLTGTADLALGEAVDLLREAGHDEHADRLERDVVGRNVVEGRWTFQLVEDYDAGYWSALRAGEAAVREDLVGGRRHLFESEMKEARRSHGRRHHESRPGSDG
jgi:hypothetical protein